MGVSNGWRGSFECAERSNEGPKTPRFAGAKYGAPGMEGILGGKERVIAQPEPQIAGYPNIE